MANLFDSVKMTRPGKNVFDLSHDVKLSCNMGYLIPTLALDCVPSDKFNIGCDSLLRFAPLVSPVMHKFDVTMHYFFVPNRILWAGWEKFITNDPAPPAFPTIEIDSRNYTLLHDYMGIPNPDDLHSEVINALPFAAYQCVFDEYYRDQNNIPEAVKWQLDNGDNTANGDLHALRKRAWSHDYFTSCLPFAQRGEAVALPLGDVKLKNPWDDGERPLFKAPDGTVLADGDLHQTPGIGIYTTSSLQEGAYDPAGTLEVGATTINDLRKAFRLQEWLEKAARGGARYVENILSFFGIKSPDSRLQRPEYITGTKSPVVISEVLQSSQSDATPQGNMAGHGFAVTQGKYGDYFCQEHGFIIGVMSIMPLPAYQQGIAKMFLKTNDVFDYYWPQFAHLGEQEVINKEIYAFDDRSREVFGYLPRYAEYKFCSNRVAADFRTSLNFWHDGRIFATRPALNKEFIECTPDPRIFAVEDPDVQKLYVQVLHKIRAIRPMPKFGTPTF